MSALTSSIMNKPGRKLAPRKPPVRRTTKANTLSTSSQPPPEQDLPPSRHLGHTPDTNCSSTENPQATEHSSRHTSSLNSDRHAPSHVSTSTTKNAEFLKQNQSAAPPAVLATVTPSPQTTDHTNNDLPNATDLSANVNSTVGQMAIPDADRSDAQRRVTRRSQRLLSSSKDGSKVNESAPQEPILKKRRLNPQGLASANDQEKSSDTTNSTFSQSQALPTTISDQIGNIEVTEHSPAVNDTSDHSSNSRQAQQIPNDTRSSDSKPGNIQRGKPRRQRKPRSPEDSGDSNSTISAQEEPTRRSNGRKRMSTPDSAEEHEIETSRATMSELCKDNRRGKKSKRETLLQKIDWDEVKKRQQEEQETGNNTVVQMSASPNPSPHLLGPQMRIVNDEFVIDETTQIVDEHARIVEEANFEGDLLDESNLTKRVNQRTVGRQSTTNGMRWDEESTERFYEGLRLFGTDLLMISNQLFDGINRDHLKRKYVKEEHEHPQRLKVALSRSLEIDGENTLQAVRELDYEDPTKVYAELAALEKTLEENYAKEQEENTGGGRRRKKKKQQDDVAESSAEVAVGDNSSKENRHDVEARRIAEEASTNRRGKKATSNKKRNHKTKPADVGTEEILGPAEELQ